MPNSHQSDNEDPSDDGNKSSNIPAEDPTEIELEKLVFGNETGFREGIKSHAKRYVVEDGVNSGGDPPDDQQQDEGDLGLLADSDLFFLDTGANQKSSNAVTWIPTHDEEPDATFDSGDPPAWEDSDDERITVSLATHSRLRKLRNFEGEDVVTGKEYVKRLRKQFEYLHPVPEWVRYATRTKPPKKRRRTLESLGGGSSQDEERGLVDEMDVDDEELSAQPLAKLLQTIDGLSKQSGKGRKLRTEVISIQRARDVGDAQPSAITSLQFHPVYPILLSSGPASTLFLHRVSPSDSVDPNPLLTSIHIRHTPISTTAFQPPEGNRIFISGQRRYFHIWDLPSGSIDKVTRIQGHADEQRKMERFKLSPCGRWMGLVGSRRKGGVGVVNILDAQTTHWIAEARVGSHGGIADFSWWQDGEGLTVAGKAGDIVEYSLQQRRVVGQWTDEGAVGTTVIALGGGSGRDTDSRHALGGDRFVAIGSSSGIINVYDRRPWMVAKGSSSSSSSLTTAVVQRSAGSIPARPSPVKALQNLTTPTSHLAFSPDGQLLVIGSRWKNNALRLVHLPSCTVYKNWPTGSTPLGRITALAFSPDSKSLAVANEAGKIRLWEILG